MSVEIYQGTVNVNDVNTFNNAINALFSAAGYAVTTDGSAAKITVQNGGAIFGLQTINLICAPVGEMLSSGTWNLVIDRDQRTLIVVSSKSQSAYDKQESIYRVAVVADGVDLNKGAGSYLDKTFSYWNVPSMGIRRTSGQPVVLTVAVDWNTKGIDAPIFVCTNAVVYPLGTIIQDGSSKFVSDGNGLAIRVKE